GKSINNHRIKTLIQFASEFLFLPSHEYASVAYLHEHYDEEVKLADLAKLEGLHPFYYSEWLKNNIGVLPSKYIQNLRLEKAKELLRETNYSVLEIAIEVGYSHASSLTRLFKKTDNISPKQYRSNL